ncbi:MAG TPA: aspartate ammonia-lyase [Candidatus Agrococcus pullicola]|uniref:Aspartate ammonia-lyase n=1 Tax=Candidatus Agrococcus pullicola TaxID=2838429 RepID=A0A9D1YWQ1_9MICO|nr:aspartate ammonia-lyase [Candidatus Agrococcus pullicola]
MTDVPSYKLEPAPEGEYAVSGPTRTERDSLGELEVPADAYYGIHTVRALQNFPITGRSISVYGDLVRALAMVKQACARANNEIGVLSDAKTELIGRACDRIIAGEFHEQFAVGVMQGGAGTSTNMNTNEVIANICLEMLGYEKGDYRHFHPIDDVNRSQSTNDTYPTSIKVAMSFTVRRLSTELGLLIDSFQKKSEEFSDVLKVGRTQMQDAVPMTVGQEMGGWANTLREELDRFDAIVAALSEVNLGATAIGTGITADPRYAAAAAANLAQITDLPIRTAHDLVEATSDTGVFMRLSAALKRFASKLSKICNDLRLLSSGPQAGLGELALPAKQAGSSIMPGKVNPVIPEVVNQVAFSVIGADVTVTMAAEAGQLQLNAFEPVIAHSLLQSLHWLTQACLTLRVNCIDGIEANRDRLNQMVGTSVGVVTALTPYIGYVASADLAHRALTSNRSIIDLVVDSGLMKREDVERLLQPSKLSSPQPVTQSIPIVRQ